MDQTACLFMDDISDDDGWYMYFLYKENYFLSSFQVPFLFTVCLKKLFPFQPEKQRAENKVQKKTIERESKKELKNTQRPLLYKGDKKQLERVQDQRQSDGNSNLMVNVDLQKKYQNKFKYHHTISCNFIFCLLAVIRFV